MTGWIKLPRQLIANGYFRMPELAFKIWIYCLLKASPFPNGELKVSELALSYKEIQQQSQANKTISKSTIANNLRYLEENNYLEIQANPFKQLKVTVRNWQQYQFATGTPTVPDGYADSTHTSTLTVPDEYTDSTRCSTLTVPGEYTDSTRCSTLTVPVDSPEASNTKASDENKNKVKNNKELVKNITPEYIKQQFPRYSNMQCVTIKSYWCIATNSANGKTAAQIIPKYMNQWEQFNVDVVINALNIHLEKHADKRANYTLGIMRRLQQELESGVSKGGNSRGCIATNTESPKAEYRPSRYGHLARN